MNDYLLNWIFEKIQSILKTPKMFGSLEAVEMQILILLETRDAMLGCDDSSWELYNRFLQNKYKGKKAPLFELCKSSEDEFVSMMKEFVEYVG